jgi:hypothetical protein
MVIPPSYQTFHRTSGCVDDPDLLYPLLSGGLRAFGLCIAHCNVKAVSSSTMHHTLIHHTLRAMVPLVPLEANQGLSGT